MVAYFVYFSTLKKEATCSSENSVNFYWTTRRHISQDTTLHGHDIIQALSRWFSTAAALVRAPVRSCGICGGQSGTGAGFLLVLRFSLKILIPLTIAQSSSFIIRRWYNRRNNGRYTMWAQSQPHPKELKKKRRNLHSHRCDLKFNMSAVSLCAISRPQ
jgi:hypothetical protein